MQVVFALISGLIDFDFEVAVPPTTPEPAQPTELVATPSGDVAPTSAAQKARAASAPHDQPEQLTLLQ
jgi:hypothetical protein